MVVPTTFTLFSRLKCPLYPFAAATAACFIPYYECQLELLSKQRDQFKTLIHIKRY
jgi:hypothetical protein